MPRHSQSYVTIHAVWSTYKRASVIGPNLDARVVAILQDEATKLMCPLLATGIARDHVHVLFGLATTTSIAALVNAIKGVSSRFLDMRLDGRKWGWQRGYWCQSIADRDIAPLTEYLRGQREKHDDTHWAEQWMREQDGTR